MLSVYKFSMANNEVKLIIIDPVKVENCNKTAILTQ